MRKQVAFKSSTHMLDVHAHYDDQFLKQFDLLRVYSGWLFMVAISGQSLVTKHYLRKPQTVSVRHRTDRCTDHQEAWPRARLTASRNFDAMSLKGSIATEMGCRRYVRFTPAPQQRPNNGHRGMSQTCQQHSPHKPDVRATSVFQVIATKSQARRHFT